MIDKKCEWAELEVDSKGRPCKKHQLHEVVVNEKNGRVKKVGETGYKRTTAIGNCISVLWTIVLFSQICPSGNANANGRGIVFVFLQDPTRESTYQVVDLECTHCQVNILAHVRDELWTIQSRIPNGTASWCGHCCYFSVISLRAVCFLFLTRLLD